MLIFNINNGNKCLLLKQSRKGSFCPLFLEFFDFFFLLELWYFLSFQPFLNFLAETFDASAEQIKIIISFFIELSSILHAWLLVKVVNDDDLVFFVLVVEQLR